MLRNDPFLADPIAFDKLDTFDENAIGDVGVPESV